MSHEFSIREIDLDCLNSLTKYPSIPTYHKLGERGKLTEHVHVPFPPQATVHASEKIDGTNVRIVLTPDAHILVGSREDWLWDSRDLIGNPAMGIVVWARGVVPRLQPDLFRAPLHLRPGDASPLVALYGELYGQRIGAAAKQYTRTGAIGFRLFDAAVFPSYMDLLARDRQQISAWRESGGQWYLGREQLLDMAAAAGLEMVPDLGILQGADIPTSREETYEWLKRFGSTQAGLDLAIGAAQTGRAEGIVIRTHDRGAIAKLRFADYEKALKVAARPTE